MSQCALTTFDNPFNPITDFINWFMYDEEKGYGSSSIIARLAKTSSSLSDEENEEEIERAIDEFLKYEPSGVYAKATPETSTPIDTGLLEESTE